MSVSSNITRVLPLNNENPSEIWKDIYMKRLEEILSLGKVVPKYKYSTPMRIYNVIITSLCCTTLCSPCLLWDCVCGMLSCICKNPCKYGCTCMVITKTMDKTFEDLEKTKLSNIKVLHIEYDCLKTVCDAYISAFNTCISKKTVVDSKKANIIREQLVQIIRKYTPTFKYVFYEDTGNIEDIISIVNKLPLLYVSNGFNAIQKTNTIYEA